MKKRFFILLAGVWAAVCPANVLADSIQDEITGLISNFLPGVTSFAKPKVDSVEIDDRIRTVDIQCNESTSYIPFTEAQLSELKAQIRRVLPANCVNYKINIYADGTNIDHLVSFAPKSYVAPSEKHAFITPLGRPKANKGLDGSNIALWQSHGLYYQGHDQWGWQRPRLFQTCEDLFTQSFVMPFLMPMLQNAGAYVMSPRERDTNLLEYIVDNDNRSAIYAEADGSEHWHDAGVQGFAYNGGELRDYDNPFKKGTARAVKTVRDQSKASTASWNTKIDRDDEYAVYISYQTLPNSAHDALYTVNAANGAHQFVVNQNMGGGTWIYLGHFPLKAGVSDLPIVTLSNCSKDKNAVITADAVKIGGGMGNVARHPTKKPRKGITYGYKTSGYPRFTEGARYWLQWAGAPDSVYSASGYDNEYNDDYRSRGYWVNWLAGGSSVLPDAKGLNIPVDLAFAFHSDAGITLNDSIIGTLGIYCTDNRDTYENGTSRLAARDLTNSIMTNIVDDVRATFEPQWTRRGMWNRSYAEARVPEVPTMLLELLSHQNFADMRYGLDPTFRFVVSRAVYKGMLKYLAQMQGRDYVVQPLPVRAFAIDGGENGKFRLSWAERVDSLEPTAKPKFYIIEQRLPGALGFASVASVTDTHYDVEVSDDGIYSYRIVAVNDGGMSFPSETLALRYLPGAERVMVVNGFTRVSAPDSFDFEDVAGFFNPNDPGVPYIKDIGFVGEQFEFRRDIPWMQNEIAGFGASRSDYEDKVLAGNTFDYVALHGESIAKAGYGFVSKSAEAFMSEGYDPNQPKIIDLILGNQKEMTVGSGSYDTRFKTFTVPMQRRLSQIAEHGGSIFVSGSYIASDLWCNPYSDDLTRDKDTDFAQHVLGYSWRSGHATTSGEVVGVKSQFKMFDNFDFKYNDALNYDCYAVKSPGAIAPIDSDDAAIILQYESGELPAATAYDAATHRAVAMGFPFETILSQPVRDNLMRAILQFLSK